MFCKNQTPDPPNKPVFPGSAVAARVRGFYDELISRAGVLSTAQEIELKLQQEYAVLIGNMAHIPTLNKYNKVENMLATALGWKSWLWQAPTREMTDAGAVRYALQDKARVMTNMIQGFAAFRALPEVRQMYNGLAKALPQLSSTELQEMLYDHVVAGQFPRLLNVMDSPVVKAQVEARYTQHLAKLTEVGLSPQQIQQLDKFAGRISSHFDTLRLLASNAGLDISVLRNGGYFPLQAEEAIKKLLRMTDETAGISSTKGTRGLDFADELRKSRTSNVPIVWDLQKSAKVLGMNELQLAGMLSEPGTISKLIREKLNPDQIQKLIDSHIFTEMPALSDEITEFFNESLDLPVENMAEAILTDPVRAIQAYADDLHSAAKNSAMLKTMFTEGFERGWYKSASELPPNSGKDWVRLGSDQTLQEVFSATNLREELADLYVHRTVADQMRALFNMNRSWADQSILGRGLENFTRFFRQSAILATGGLPYIKRIFSQNFISLYAATGGLEEALPSIAEVARVFGKGDIDQFGKGYNYISGAFKDGRTYSAKELFTAAFIKRGTDAVSGLADSASLAEYSKINPLRRLNPDSLKKFWKFSQVYNERYGSVVSGRILTTAELAKEVFVDSWNSVYGMLAYANQVADFAARWGAIKKLARERAGDFENLDDLFRYTDEYFNIQEDVGSLGKAYGKLGQPFASFAIAAPGAALRYTMQHPWRAGRMATLYAGATAGDNLTDAEIQQWMKDEFHITVFKDPVTGKNYGITPGSVDFYTDTATWFREMAEDVGRAMGMEVGSVKEQAEQKQNPAAPIEDAFVGAIKQTYFKFLLPLLGINPTTMEPYVDGDAEDTLVGIPLPTKLRDALGEAAPLLKALDRKLPTSIVGQSRQTAPDNPLEITQEGKPGWLGVIPQFGGTRERFQPSLSDPEQQVAWFADNVFGLSLQEIDPQKNIITTYRDFSTLETELRGTINKLNRKLLENRDSLSQTEVARLTATIDDAQKLKMVLWYNRHLIDKLAKEKGLTSPQAVEYFRSLYNRTLTKPEMLQIVETYTRELNKATENTEATEK